MAFEPVRVAMTSLFAQAEVLRGLGRPFRSSGDDWQASTLICVALVALLSYFAARKAITSIRRRDNIPVDRPARLFRELCRAHDLTWGEAALLRTLADHWKLDNPSLLFIEPTRFELVDSGDVRHLPSDRLASLRIQLFGLDTTPANGDPAA